MKLAPHLGLLVLLFSSRSASAADTFLEAPLTLRPLHVSADAGLGFGTFQTPATQTATGFTGVGQTIPATSGVGWGSNLEAAVGLPFLGELGARIGYRFDGDGVAADADHYGRLFDPIVTDPGPNDLASPEFHLRGTLVPLDVFELGLETRLVVPSSGDVGFTPGVPIRIHVPGIVRIDTGAWLPIDFSSGPNGSSYYVLDIPAQAFFAIGDAFVGPLTGIRFVGIGGSSTTTQIPLGVGGGYTFGKVFDVKAQLRTEAVNQSGWPQNAFGGGIGVGIRVP